MNKEKTDFLAGEVSEKWVRHSYYRTGALTFFFASFILLIHLSPMKEYLDEIQKMQTIMTNKGCFSVLTFAGITAVATFFGAPRLMFYTVAGMLFGFGRGLCVAQLSTLAGAYAPFMFSRWVAGDFLIKRFDRYEQLKKRLQNPTTMDVFLCRQLPVWGALVSMLLGLTNVNHSRFLLGSFLGFLPQGVIFAMLGSGFSAVSTLKSFSHLWATIFLVLIGGMVTLWIVRIRTHT